MTEIRYLAPQTLDEAIGAFAAKNSELRQPDTHARINAAPRIERQTRYLDIDAFIRQFLAPRLVRQGQCDPSRQSHRIRAARA